MNQGFTPEVTHPSEGTLWFNMSHSGAGPHFNHVILQRLLRDGIHPRRIVIEVMPAFMTNERPRFIGPFLSTRELSESSRYGSLRQCAWHALRYRVFRTENFKHLVEPCEAVAHLEPWGGASVLEETIEEPIRASRLAGQKRLHGSVVRDLKVSAGADQAIHDTLHLCRVQGIEAVLLLAPESSEFRSWYKPESLARFEAYLAALCREFNARLIDARCWLADCDFTDGHHPLRSGATAFSQRLVRELH